MEYTVFFAMCCILHVEIETTFLESSDLNIAYVQHSKSIVKKEIQTFELSD